MKIKEIRENKKRFISLLLLADEQEDMIDRYIDKGRMYVLDDDGIKCECIVTDEGGVLEIKNIAVEPKYMKQGYGRAMLDFIAEKYKGRFGVMQVGTGDSPMTVPFYEKCGFVYSHRIENFFTDNYDHPIYEGGVKLKDMVYLKRKLNEIRQAVLGDIDEIMDIWLSANIQAHGFIPKEYWENNFESVKDAISQAEVYVFDDGFIKGFAGMEENYIAGIFVLREFRAMGIGTELIRFLQEQKKELILSVYEKNENAVNFYKKHGFNISEIGIDEETGEREYHMIWVS